MIYTTKLNALTPKLEASPDSFSGRFQGLIFYFQSCALIVEGNTCSGAETKQSTALPMRVYSLFQTRSLGPSHINDLTSSADPFETDCTRHRRHSQ